MPHSFASSPIPAEVGQCISSLSCALRLDDRINLQSGKANGRDKASLIHDETISTPQKRSSKCSNCQCSVSPRNKFDDPPSDLEVSTRASEEYLEEAHAYMHRLEQETMTPSCHLFLQPKIGWHERKGLIDFLFEFQHRNENLPRSVIFCAANVADRYLSLRVLSPGHLRLLGAAALWISVKFSCTEILPLSWMMTYLPYRYDERDLIELEQEVLVTLGWNLSHISAEEWLDNIVFGLELSNRTDKEEVKEFTKLARLLLDITLYSREYGSFPPSAIALGSLCLSLTICGRQDLMPTMAESSTCIPALKRTLIHFATGQDDLPYHFRSFHYFSLARVRRWHCQMVGPAAK